MSKHYVIIEAASSTAAEAIRELIEHDMKYLIGQIRVQSEPEMTTLDKIIEGERK